MTKLDDLIRSYHALGHNPYAIRDLLAVQDFHYSVATVKIRLKYMGVKPVPKPPPPLKYDQPVNEIKSKPNPLQIAQLWLGKRLVEYRGEYRLDDRPTNLVLIMKETNRLLKASGAEQLGPTSWHYDG